MVKKKQFEIGKHYILSFEYMTPLRGKIVKVLSINSRSKILKCSFLNYSDDIKCFCAKNSISVVNSLLTEEDYKENIDKWKDHVEISYEELVNLNSQEKSKQKILKEKCINCETILDKSFKFCPNCGLKKG